MSNWFYCLFVIILIISFIILHTHLYTHTRSKWRDTHAKEKNYILELVQIRKTIDWNGWPALCNVEQHNTHWKQWRKMTSRNTCLGQVLSNPLRDEIPSSKNWSMVYSVICCETKALLCQIKLFTGKNAELLSSFCTDATEICILNSGINALTSTNSNKNINFSFYFG